MKWTNHVSNILHGLQGAANEANGGVLQEDDEEEAEALEEEESGFKLPEIHPKSR